MDDQGWESRLYRARSWIQRAASARGAADLDGRFIFYWIAFNAMYGQAGYLAEDRLCEEDRIHDFLGRMVRLDSERRYIATVLSRIEPNLIALLTNRFLWKEYWTEGFTDTLSDSIRRATNDMRAALAGVGSVARLLLRAFDRLYVLRIQVFHGCSKDGSSANRDSIEPAVAVLTRLIPLFWATMRQGGKAEDWGPLSYPAFRRAGHPQERKPDEAKS